MLATGGGRRVRYLQAAEDARRAGLPAEVVEQIESMDQADQPQTIDVWEENMRSVSIFCLVRDDLNIVGGMAAAALGVRTEAVQDAIGICQVPRRERERVYADIKLMGNAYASAMNQQSASK